jgi:hypothetical protein
MMTSKLASWQSLNILSKIKRQKEKTGRKICFWMLCVVMQTPRKNSSCVLWIVLSMAKHHLQHSTPFLSGHLAIGFCKLKTEHFCSLKRFCQERAMGSS